MKTAAAILSLVLAVPLACATPARAAEKPFELADGDRVVLVGNDFVERDLDQGYIETRLTSRFPDKNLTFRNLGYSGDTVFADARNLCAGWENFGPPEQGFNRLKELIGHLNPTVIFVAYGMNESFEGERGVANFERGLERMLDMLGEGRARIVLISPIRHESLPRPLPDPSEHNRKLGLYVAAIASAAGRHGYPFIDLFSALGDGTKATPAGAFTRDGVHLTPYGYWRAAAAIEEGLGYPARTWHVELGADGSQARVEGTRLAEVKASADGLSFEATDTVLPAGTPPGDAPAAVADGRVVIRGAERVLRVTGLRPGRYTLKSGTTVLASAAADEWSKGVQLVSGPAEQQVDLLRSLIRAKNADFFNYWRPENDTYILGYRKGEQGRNAVELPRFEPLAAAKDAEIGKLRVPAPVAYTFAPSK